MSSQAGCPRCSSPLTRSTDGHECPAHGLIDPLWRPRLASYDAFADHLRASTALPTYLPWPLSPGWTVTDFACVSAEPSRATATMTCCTGPSALDGPVDVIVVVEEAGVGLGARIAGMSDPDPGAHIGAEPPSAHVRLERHSAPLWQVPTVATEQEADRTVLAGEADGRWLWMMLRPASAVLLLQDDWTLRDAAQMGPHLVELPFGGPAPIW